MKLRRSRRLKEEFFARHRARQAELAADPACQLAMGFWLFSAMAGTCGQEHSKMNGGIAPFDWPGWKEWEPPFNRECACCLVGITGSKAKRLLESGEGFDLTKYVPLDIRVREGGTVEANVRRALRKMQPVMLEAQKDNLNEADTAQRLVIFFQEVLGYDPLTEISREAQVKDKYVDIALKIDGAVKMLVEAKAAGVDLRDRHIDQAKSYAAEGNIRWVILTNGVIWSLYHLTFEEGIEYERLFLADLATDNLDEAAEKLALVHRRSVARDRHEKFWKRHTALDAASLGKAVYTENVLRLLRRDIRRREGILVDEEDLAAAIHAMLSPEAREKCGPVRIRRPRSARATKQDEAGATAAPAAPGPTPAASGAAPPTTGPPEKA